MKTKEVEYNIGLALLRILLSFTVVLNHFFDINSVSYNIDFFNKLCFLLKIIGTVAVPVFFIMSFYFTEKVITNYDKDTVTKRLKRLIIPQLFWTIIYFVILKVMAFFTSNVHSPSIQDFLYQLLFGHSKYINASMWYQVDLIIITYVYVLLYKYLKNKKGTICICIISIFAIALQYTGINYTIFKDLVVELKYPLGRLLEVIPYATIGILLAKFNINKYANKKIIHTILPILSIIIFCFLCKYEAKINVMGFYYQGLLILTKSVTLFITFYFLPIGNVAEKVKKIIIYLSQYTLGVYCIHKLIGLILEQFINNKLNGTMEYCIIIFILSYIVIWIISFIPLKIIKKSVK